MNQYSLKRGDSKSCRCFDFGWWNKKENYYENKNNYCVGYDCNNNIFIFDKADFELIKSFCWYIDSHGYARTFVKGRKIYLHRLIMGCMYEDEKIVDHKNRNKNDCRRCNLRFVNNSENVINKNIRRDNKSGFTGVFWNKKRKKWEAFIRSDKKISLGFFDKKEDAVRARKDAEQKYYKDILFDKTELNNKTGGG